MPVRASLLPSKSVVSGFLRLRADHLIGFNAFISLVVGLLGLVGWIGHLPVLLQGWAGAPVMALDTAVLFVFASLGLFALQQNRLGIARKSGILLMIGSAFSFAAAFTDLPVSLTHFFLTSVNSRVLSPTQAEHAHMSYPAILVLFLFGCALYVLSRQVAASLALWLVALSGAFIASIGCLGILVLGAAVSTGHWWNSFLSQMPFPVALASVALGIALCAVFWTKLVFRQQRTPILAAALSLASVLFLFAGVDFAIFVSADATIETRKAIAETYRNSKTVQLLVETVREAETEQRGFLLTSRREYLQNYEHQVRLVSSALTELHLPTTYPEKQASLFRSLIAQKMVELARTIELEERNHHDEAVAVVKSDGGLSLMKGIDAEADTIARLFQIALKHYSDDNWKSVRLIRKTVACSYILAVLLTGLSLYLVVIELKRRSAEEKLRRQAESELEELIDERTRELIEEISQKQQTEQALRQTEQRLETALAFSGVAAWTWNIHEDAVVWSGPVQQVYGFSAAELNSYVKFQSLIHPGDRQAVNAALEVAGETGADYTAEFRVALPDGQIRWIAGRGGALRQDGKLVQMSGVNFDITPQKRVEQNLREKDRQLAMIFESGTIGNFNWNVAEDKLICHPTIWKLYGAEAQESAPAQWFTDRQHKDDAVMIERAVKDMLEGRSALDIEFRVNWPDDSVHWLACRAVAVHDGNGAPVQVNGINIDITERKLAEMKLKESEQQFRHLANAMPQIVWTAQPNGHPAYFNDRWYDLNGFERGTAINETWQSVLHPNDLQPCLKGWLRSVQSGQTFENELRMWDKQRRAYRWYLCRAVPVPNAENQIIRWLGTCTEIHNQKEAKELLEAEVALRTDELRRSLLEKETLLKEVHHRVKNNLQVISSLLKMQVDLIKDNAAASAALNESRQRVFSMALIHERLYGNQKMDEIDFGEYTQTLVGELFYSYSRSTNVFTKLKLSPIMLGIDQAIPCGLILNELITNALKYAYPDNQYGEILVELKEVENNCVSLTVSDNGVGLPEGFEWQRSNTLGLSIIDILAHQIGGSLAVQSQAGATFTVVFPKETISQAVDAAAVSTHCRESAPSL